MRLLVTDAAAQPPRQATAWLIMTLGKKTMHLDHQIIREKQIHSRFTTEELKAKLAICDVPTTPTHIALKLLLDEKLNAEEERKHREMIAVGTKANRMAKFALFISLVAAAISLFQVFYGQTK